MTFYFNHSSISTVLMTSVAMPLLQLTRWGKVKVRFMRYYCDIQNFAIAVFSILRKFHLEPTGGGRYARKSCRKYYHCQQYLLQFDFENTRKDQLNLFCFLVKSLHSWSAHTKQQITKYCSEVAVKNQDGVRSDAVEPGPEHGKLREGIQIDVFYP